LSDQRTINLVVASSNDAPVVVPVGDQTMPAGQILTLHVQATDPNGDGLTYSVTNLQQAGGAAIDPASGILTWTPAFYQVGNYAGIMVSASDGNLSSSSTFAIHVTSVNQPPKLVPMAPQFGAENSPMQFTVVSDDPDNDALTYSVISGLPAGAQFN